jgi:hypothetical protein
MVAAGCNGCAALHLENVHGDIAARVGAVAQLAEGIVTPADHPAFRRDGAGVGSPGCDRMGLSTGHRDDASRLPGLRWRV